MRKLVGKTCKDLGFTDITEAADGAKAWEAIMNATPPIGLVVSDWNMPNSTGIDLLKRVRADSRFQAMPFVLVTAEAEAHQVKEALTAGVDNYVVKPFTPASLKEKLEAVYKKKFG
jgi:two-component system chemotaxis response regulator CheY